MSGSHKIAETTKKAAGTGIICANEPSRSIGGEVSPPKSENWCHFYIGVVALGCKKTSFPVLEERRGVCYVSAGW